ncbi:MAG: protein kinase, partial [Planctomycetaceae bacterium]|nr:protein kinase [Planctomycetaceae bacterium]
KLPVEFGRYRVQKVLGQGAMGAVYLAHDTKLARDVALKTPKLDVLEGGELVERFEREARAAATLHHRNICPVFDVGEIDGRHYISMQYIDGKLLSELKRPFSPKKAAQVVRRLAVSLAAAHRQGVVHRDLKPSNVMIDVNQKLLIMDFGLALREDTVAPRVTQDGMTIGTPHYMAPEQVRGDKEHIGPQSDVYSLGVILYELLTGDVPFDGPLMAVLGQVLAATPESPSLRVPAIDARIESICLKMMAKQTEDRFPSMKLAADALGDYLEGSVDSESSKASAEPKAESAVRSEETTGQEQAKTMLTAAKRMFEQREYERASQLLQHIPEQQRDSEISLLLAESIDLSDEVQLLTVEIDRAVRKQDTDRLAPAVERLLQLQPQHRKARKLHKELESTGLLGWSIGDAKGKAKAKQKSGEAGNHKFLWMYIGGAVLTLAIVMAIFQLYGVDPDQARNAKTAARDPVTLIKYEDEPGETFYFRVTGSTTGLIYGSLNYTTDSLLSVAVVHAGILAPDESGIVKVTIVESSSSTTFNGTEKNGVTSHNFNAPAIGYRVALVAKDVP